MGLFRVVNATRQKILAAPARKSTDFFGRAIGLMFSKSLPDGSGLILQPCSSIHMFWMSYPIDAIFLDKNDRVVGIAQEIKPWRTSKMYWQAQTCVELPAGTIAKTQTCAGDTLIMQEIATGGAWQGPSLLDLVSKKRFAVVVPTCTVGSDPGSNIVCDFDQSISPTHFVMQEQSGNYTIEDNISRHGTFVNGNKIQAPSPIKSGDIIKAGARLFLFEC